MNREEIGVLFEYDRWATNKLLEIIGRIPEDLYLKNLGSSHGGLRGTLVHMIGAGEVWLKRWSGENPTVPWKEEDFPTFASMSKRWTSYQAAFADFFPTLTNERLAAPLTYRDMKGNEYTVLLWKQMQHLVNHGSYHRGQLVAMLRIIGMKPVGTDLIHYYRQAEKNG